MSSLFSGVGIATTVMLPELTDSNRAVALTRLAIGLDGVARAVHTGFPCFVVYKGGNAELQEMLGAELKRLGAFGIPEPEEGGPKVSRQLAMSRALASPQTHVVQWIEIEKIGEALTGNNLTALHHGYRIMADKRVEALTWDCGELHGYPQHQRDLEKQAEEEIAQITGLQKYDPFRGPFAFHRDLGDFILFYDGFYGDVWEVTCILQELRCLGAGYNVGILPMHTFRYPLAQSLVESGDPGIERKRVVQQRIVNNVQRFVADMSTKGLWPPKGRFVQLDTP